MGNESGTAPARIGSSDIPFVLGIACLVIGALSALGGALILGVSSFFTTTGGVLILAGFLVGLFGKIERRLIDIEKTMRAAPTLATEAPPRRAPAE